MQKDIKNSIKMLNCECN